jgi:NADH-quinone oxidoreductase subunit K
MNIPLSYYIVFSALLFSIGFAGAVTRRNAILVLIGVELMLNAANLNFIAFWRYGVAPEILTGMVVTIFSIAIAAAEAAVGLALVIAIYKHRKTMQVEKFDTLKG